MMNCIDIQNLLADYLGDELETVERSRFEDHVATCSSCRSEVAGLREVLGDLRELPVVTAEDAARRTQDLCPDGGLFPTGLTDMPRLQAAQANRAVRLFYSLLRSAALLAVGVALGWAWKPAAPQEVDGRLGQADGVGGRVVREEPAVAEGINPQWISTAAEAYRHNGGCSSLARNLATLSALKHGA